MKTHRIYRFGPFRLDAQAKVLLRDEEPVRLTRKAIETLLALVESSGEVRTKEELMHTVWPDRVVDEANLAQNVAVIRKALAVVDGNPGAVETFPGRGYRIIGPIYCEEPFFEQVQPQPGIPPARSLPSAYLTSAVVLALAIAAFGWLWFRGRAAVAPDQLHPVPVTRFAGKEHQPAVSPDGQWLAFVWERESEPQGRIWIQQMAGGAARPVTRPNESVTGPAWSPDGRQFAYLRFQHGRGALIVQSLSTGAEREITSVFPTRYRLPFHHVDWSPDGRRLVFDDASSTGGALGIFVVSVETGERHRLTRPEDLIIGDLEPRFSPDGTSVSFIRAFHRAEQELYTIPAAGGTPHPVTGDARQITSQDWMADGSALVFSSNRSGEFRLWKMPTRMGRTAQPQQIAIYSDLPMQLAISRRSHSLVYSVVNHDLNLWRLDLASSADASSRWFRVVASSGLNASPQYSPAGDRICFRSDRSGDEQLWIAGADGAQPVQITRGTIRPSVGRWSPDGRTVIFNNPTTRQIFAARQKTDGSWTAAPLNVNGIHPVFSPDGRWIYAGTDTSIVSYPAAGGPSREVIGMRGISLDISADGRYLYFVRDPSGTSLWRVQTATGHPEKVLDGLVPYCSSCWAQSSTGIYYLGAGDGGPDTQALRFHDLNTGTDRILVPYPEPLIPLGAGPFSLSADGRYLLCIRVENARGDVFKVEPFR
jgi:Tol biopolymer transport system component/DNA-binding winged helix-turn-helix (wHTH) protein